MPKSSGVKVYSAEELAKLESVLNKDRAKLDMMRDDFATFQQSRESEFVKNLPTLLSEDEMEAIELESDPVKIYQALKTHEKAFVEEAVAAKSQELDAFASDLENAQDKFDMISVESAFFSENPDMDAEGFIAFLQGKMAPDDVAELMEAAKGDNSEYLRLVKGKFDGGTGGTANPADPDGDDPEDALPADLDLVPGEAGDADGDLDASEDDSAYLRSIGLA